ERLGDLHGFDYRPGRADRARRGVSFPVWKKSDTLPPETEVYIVRQAEATTAYPVDVLLRERVVNDMVGGQAVVLVADSASGAVRAYRREGELAAESPDVLVDSEGRRFRVLETGLEAMLEGGEKGVSLERLPGHFAYWFGWYAFYPRTEVYRGSVATGN
ncbi:MAG: DUF3179 domain-containing protein, partial [Holophagales bacterium]|nr:DUF3179 domain-containing protein [Holophagales bacterium]